MTSELELSTAILNTVGALVVVFDPQGHIVLRSALDKIKSEFRLEMLLGEFLLETAQICGSGGAAIFTCDEATGSFHPQAIVENGSIFMPNHPQVADNPRLTLSRLRSLSDTVEECECQHFSTFSPNPKISSTLAGMVALLLLQP